MIKKQTKKLILGLYRVYWKSGGSSLASIGQDRFGCRWIAPCNWLSDDRGLVGTLDWEDVKYVRLIKFDK